MRLAGRAFLERATEVEGSVHPPSDSQPRTWAEICPSALRHNVKALRARAPQGAALMAVVKADAYGHGVDAVVPVLRGLVDWFGVANLQEAEQVRILASETPLMILGPALPSEREAIARHGFVPVVSSFEEAAGYAVYAGSSPVPVHLAVDTGMGRVGVHCTEAVALARAIKALPGVRISGVGSHFPSADEHDDSTRAQAEVFRALVCELRAHALVEGPAHIANSAAALGFPETAPDLFRAGLALYGSSPRGEFQSLLKPVLTWKTRVALVREVPSGWGLSYGSTFVTPHAMRVATLAVGYADGYRRHLSGRGACVLVGGRRCPVLGRVTMDQILVDVGGVEAAEAGSEVVLLGAQGAERISVEELAGLSGTIPWDVFTGLGRRVVRVLAD